jgi:molybdopterin-guanine dinucleotide biosynthesis protein B
MKVFSVAGYHRTGKTTVVVELIKELKKREFKVVSIKDIHAEDFSMENKDSNSWKHWEASRDTVIARGLNETYQIWHRQLSLNEMLAHLEADYVVVEGMRSVALPRIICAENQTQLDELVDGTVFAISGIYAYDHNKYKQLPVLKSTEEVSQLADLVEKKVFEVLPLPRTECCGECGLTCREMVTAILAGERKREDCKTDRNTGMKLKIGGKEITIVPYVQKTFIDIIKAYLQNLKGYKEGEKIEIEIND